MIEVYGTGNGMKEAAERRMLIRKIANDISEKKTSYDAVCLEAGYCSKRSDLESIRHTIEEAGVTSKLNQLNRLNHGNNEAQEWVYCFLLGQGIGNESFSWEDLAAMAAMATGKSVWSIEPYEPIFPESKRLISRTASFNKEVRVPLVVRNLRQVEKEYDGSILHVTHNGDKDLIETMLKIENDEFDKIVQEALSNSHQYLDMTKGKEPDKAHMLIL